MDAFATALTQALSLQALLSVLIGSFVGLVFGAIPGLTFSMALALILPVTFSMESGPAIALLLSTYIGGMTGGSVSAILLGIPGTPSATATVFDGHALAMRGKASVALGLAVIASGLGGLLSLMVMMVSVDLVAKLAIEFGPVEIFAIVVFGLSTICGLAESSILRGLIAGVIGLMLMTIGLDELDAVQRLTFGSVTMQQGINLVVAMIGLFAVPHIIQVFVDYAKGGTVDAHMASVHPELPSWAMLRRNLSLMLRSSALGTAIGAIPGTGGPIAAFLAYDHAKRFSKDKSKFGKGAEEGIVAPEAANNAVTGGAMIPLLSLGIPGDPATAVILSGLLIHGLVPGPLLFSEHPVEIYAIYAAVILSYIAVVAMQLYGIRIFVRVLRIPSHILAVCLIVMCVFGSYAIRNSVFDVYTLAVIGLMSYVLIRVRIPMAPVILGLVLGPTLEREFRTAVIMGDGGYGLFLESPPALVFIALAVLVVTLQVVSSMRSKKREQMAASGQENV